MKRSKITASLIYLIAFAGLSAYSAEPARAPQEQQVLDRALDFWHNVFLPLKLDQWKDYVTADYVEHYPGLKGGVDSMVGFFKPIKEKAPNGLPPSEPVLSMVDGDITLMVLAGDSVDNKQGLHVELQRWKNGKQTEHWDTDAAKAPATGPQVAGRNAVEKRNLQRALEYFSQVLRPAKTSAVKNYVSVSYVEHDAQYPGNNREALVKSLESTKQDTSPVKIVMSLVDADLVSISSVKNVPDPKDAGKMKQILGIDIFRVKDHLIVEHWGDSRRPS